MPTYEWICDAHRGDPAAVWKVGLGTASRAAFIGAGIYAAGERDPKKLAAYAVAGSLAVEAFALTYVWWNSPGAWKAR